MYIKELINHTIFVILEVNVVRALFRSLKVCIPEKLEPRAMDIHLLVRSQIFNLENKVGEDFRNPELSGPT